MNKSVFVLGALTSVVVLSACTRTVAPLDSVTPLPAAPAGNVQQQSLEPVPITPATPGQTPEQLAGQTTADGTGQTQIASAPTTAPTAVNSKPLERGSVAGAWDVQVAGGTCRFFTSFTRRAQHYQATALRCPSPELSQVREWDVSGNQLVLYDAGGAATARLFKTADNRFDGKTSGGTAITFSRES